uniref:Uncharacterized protein n=1 Tax=Meloidogyne enterolobii TaxID=390850 RepID=A0A6V7X5Y2_MELEN|nr:unnamed protein product [Meloidogyne enterolobii]
MEINTLKCMEIWGIGTSLYYNFSTIPGMMSMHLNFYLSEYLHRLLPRIIK